MFTTAEQDGTWLVDGITAYKPPPASEYFRFNHNKPFIPKWTKVLDSGPASVHDFSVRDGAALLGCALRACGLLSLLAPALKYFQPAR